ncbi:MAG: 30S ribosomal protein S17 [Deltaproteobacteria bacterium]|nr:30S ribosomal protein S17 [Deltaproteobacteria bacterium]
MTEGEKTNGAGAGEGAKVPSVAARPRRAFRRKLVGVITSDRMDKTVTVEVLRRYLHPKYKKYVRSRKRYKAHDELNRFHIGDRVEIQEHRPLSKTKRWIVTRLVAAAAETEG